MRYVCWHPDDQCSLTVAGAGCSDSWTVQSYVFQCSGLLLSGQYFIMNYIESHQVISERPFTISNKSNTGSLEKHAFTHIFAKLHSFQLKWKLEAVKHQQIVFLFTQTMKIDYLKSYLCSALHNTMLYDLKTLLLLFVEL